MLHGISNLEIKRVFKDVNNSDLNENFLDFFPSDKINKFAIFEIKIPEKQDPFIILDRDRKD